MDTKILIADDHKIVREGLRTLLDKEMGLSIVGEAQTGREALSMARKLNPDIIIMDITMPDLNGIDATRQILNIEPGTKIIALSMHSDKQFIKGMLKAGAMAYLLKDCAVDELIEAISTVKNKKIYISPAISDTVVKDYLETLALSNQEEVPILSDREKEVLQLIAEGYSTKEIAQKLFISVKTVESHRKKIMDKLELFTLPDLTKYAIRTGLTSLDN